MNEIITNYNIGPRILDLINKSKKSVILISPYLYFWKHLTDGIEKCIHQKEIPVLLITSTKGFEQIEKNTSSKDDLDEEDEDNPISHLQYDGILTGLREIGVDVCYHENLHTKLYLSEKCGIITSMNLYDYSMKSNEEIGFYTEDKELLDKLNGYVKELLPNCGEFHVPWKSSDSKPERMGICIRCGENEVPFQIFVSPSLCDECFTIWKKYGENPEYPENYCLGCRKKHKTSVKRPLCKDCTYDRMWGVESDDDEFVVQESELNLEEKYFGDEPQK